LSNATVSSSKAVVCSSVTSSGTDGTRGVWGVGVVESIIKSH